MSTENGMPVVQPFDFSQDNWQADIKHLDAEKRALFLKALELEFPDLRWNSGAKPSEFIACYDFLFRGFFGGCYLTYGSTQTCFAHATQAHVTLFISEYLEKVEKMEKELHPVGVIHDDGCCSLIEMGITPKSLHVPDANNVRAHNVGSSDYAQHKIQPWDIWLEYGLNPWEADIVKRTLRTKAGQSRREDFEKVIHIAQECIRQIDAGEYRR